MQTGVILSFVRRSLTRSKPGLDGSICAGIQGDRVRASAILNNGIRVCKYGNTPPRLSSRTTPNRTHAHWEPKLTHTVLTMFQHI